MWKPTRIARTTRIALAGALVCALGFATGADAQATGTRTVRCQLLYETADGVYVDLGTDRGLAEGDAGWIERDGRQIVRFEVLNVSSDSAFLRFRAPRDETFPEPGDTLTLLLDRAIAPAPEDPERERSPTLKDGEEKEHTPLLAPYYIADLADVEPRNVFHGRLRLRQYGQASSDGDLDFYRSHIGSVGSLERMGGTPWALEWSWDVSYRDGDALKEVREHQEPNIEIYQLSLYRRYDDRSFVRLGRFIPHELPAVGHMDGIQGEKVIDDAVRIGAIVGFRATRDDIDLRGREPTVVPYITVMAGDRERFHYTGTVGWLLAAYEGEADRFAVLWDQTASIGALSILASSEIDVDIGGAEFTDEEVRLSRLNLSSGYALSDSHTLRAGVDRFELPDTEAERDLVNDLILPEELFFQQGYWRYWVGGAHRLGDHWLVSEEVSYTDDDIEDSIHWLATLTRRGLPGMPSGHVSLSVYNLTGDDQDGFGGRISAHLPWNDSRLSLQPSVSFRVVEFEPRSDDFEVLDVALRAHWWLSDSWTIAGGLSFATTEDEQRILADVGVTFRW